MGSYVGISGKIQVLNEAKLVIFRIEDGETNYLAYPMPTAYGDDHWKWLISGGPFSGANKTREFIIGSLGATRKGGVEMGTTQEWHLL